MVIPLESTFPGLQKGNYRITSPKNKDYNCFAWAIGQTAQWFWPVPDIDDVTWPTGIPREETLSAFGEALKHFGYVGCLTENYEPGVERIALFADSQGVPTHASRQLANGQWTSKLGAMEDIEHLLRDLEGDLYGSVVRIFQRQVKSSNAPKPVIGLIGGIGSGKSSIAAEFARHGAAVISGDKLGHEALRQPEIRTKVVQRFGPEILDANGEIDRKKLGAVVFSEIGKLRELEKIVFPFIENGIRKQVAAARNDPAIPLIVVDAAVMLEAGWNNLCDKIVFVDTSLEKRVFRLAQQRGWSEGELLARSKTQLSLAEKSSRADATIDNSGLPSALASQVSQLLTTWRIPVAFQSGLRDNA